MRLTKEQIEVDDKRWAKRDIMEELRWCSVEVGDRVHITNDDLHFFAFVARKAYELLKEKQPVKPIQFEKKSKVTRDKFECGACGGSEVFKQWEYCPWCGVRLDW